MGPFIHPQIPEISDGNQIGRTISVRSDRNIWELPLQVVHFDQSGHFGRSDRNFPFHLTKLLSSALFLCILLTRTIIKRAVAVA